MISDRRDSGRDCQHLHPLSWTSLASLSPALYLLKDETCSPLSSLVEILTCSALSSLVEIWTCSALSSMVEIWTCSSPGPGSETWRRICRASRTHQKTSALLHVVVMEILMVLSDDMTVVRTLS